MVASKSSTHKRKLPAKTRAITFNLEVTPLSLRTKDLPNRPITRGQIPIQLRPRTPLWLLRLYALQRPSAVVMFLLVAAMLSVYSWTVYSQKMWSQSYRKLVTLQRHERQLTATSEVLKNKMALQAEQPITNLVPPNPTEAIFLPIAPQRPNQAASTLLTTDAKTKQPNQIPLGY